MKVLWSPTAIADLIAIRSYIASDSPAVAQTVAVRLIVAANSLETLPRRGRPGRAPGTRELVVPGTPYIIVYGLEDDIVQIASIDQAARRA